MAQEIQELPQAQVPLQTTQQPVEPSLQAPRPSSASASIAGSIRFMGSPSRASLQSRQRWATSSGSCADARHARKTVAHAKLAAATQIALEATGELALPARDDRLVVVARTPRARARRAGRGSRDSPRPWRRGVGSLPSRPPPRRQSRQHETPPRGSSEEVNPDGGRQRGDRLTACVARRLEARAERALARGGPEAVAGIADHLDPLGPAVGAHGDPQDHRLLVDLPGVGLGGPRAAPGRLVQRHRPSPASRGGRRVAGSARARRFRWPPSGSCRCWWSCRRRRRSLIRRRTPSP